IQSLHLNDRAADIWKPIFAVAQGVGIEKKDKQWSDISTLATEMGGDPDYAEEARQLAIFRALRALSKPEGKIMGMTTDILKRVQESAIQITAIELTHLLETWGFKQKDIRLPQGPRRAWELTEGELTGVEAQFLSRSS